MVGIANRKKVTFSPLQSGLSPTRQQRQHALVRAQDILDEAETLLWIAIIFITFFYPLVLNPTLLFDLPAWAWWVKGFAWTGVSVWVVVRLLVALPLAPGQLTGATVEAMEQAPLADEGFFPRVSTPIEQMCAFLFWKQKADNAERQSVIRVQWYWQQLWRRPRHRFLYNAPLQRHLPSSSLLEIPA